MYNWKAAIYLAYVRPLPSNGETVWVIRSGPVNSSFRKLLVNSVGSGLRDKGRRIETRHFGYGNGQIFAITAGGFEFDRETIRKGSFGAPYADESLQWFQNRWQG
uniref:Uncharacterized protein n=1 Tax=Romanomermis culicivorax TaxID=13658 RepID=A0A915KVZ4_ROMCU